MDLSETFRNHVAVVVETPNDADGWVRVGRAIQARRVDLRLSEDALAVRAGVATNTIRSLIAGRTRTPKPVKVAQIEDALGWTRGSIAAVHAGYAPTMIVDMERVDVGDPNVTAYLGQIGGVVADIPPEKRDEAVRLALALLREMKEGAP